MGCRPCIIDVGRSNDGGPDCDSDPATFHETMCRQWFKDHPVRGKGCQAQNALLRGGTLDNGKVALEIRWSHGVMLRELIAKVRFEHGDDVTCY